ILSMHAAGVTNARTSTTGLDSVAIDFYSLLPEDLASDVGIAYVFTSRMPPQPAMAGRAAERVEASLKALETYGEDKLGLKFGPSEVRLRRTEQAFLKREPEPQADGDPQNK